MVLQSFDDVSNSGVFEQIVLVVFMLIFYAAVQNVFMTIIMEGYIDATD